MSDLEYLALTRRKGQKIVINGNIVVTVVRLDDTHVALGIQAPPDVKILRGEIAGKERNNAAD